MVNLTYISVITLITPITKLYNTIFQSITTLNKLNQCYQKA